MTGLLFLATLFGIAIGAAGCFVYLYAAMKRAALQHTSVRMSAQQGDENE